MLLTTLGLLLSGCFMAPMALIGPATSGFTTINETDIELPDLITDLQDKTDKKGFIAIQHHGEEGQVYRFRKLMLLEL